MEAADRFKTPEVKELEFAIESFQDRTYDTLLIVAEGEAEEYWYISRIDPPTAQYMIGRLEVMKQRLVEYIRDHDNGR